MDHRIVIIGGGFAGVNLACQLKNEKDVMLHWWIKTTTISFNPCCIRLLRDFSMCRILVSPSEACSRT